MENEKIPPGSKEAVDAGCTCPVIDNHYGRGYWGDGEKYGFVISETCKLHVKVIKESSND